MVALLFLVVGGKSKKYATDRGKMYKVTILLFLHSRRYTWHKKTMTLWKFFLKRPMAESGTSCHWHSEWRKYFQSSTQPLAQKFSSCYLQQDREDRSIRKVWFSKLFFLASLMRASQGGDNWTSNWRKLRKMTRKKKNEVAKSPQNSSEWHALLEREGLLLLWDPYLSPLLSNTMLPNSFFFSKSSRQIFPSMTNMRSLHAWHLLWLGRTHRVNQLLH